jgi:hypothetical protein
MLSLPGPPWYSCCISSCWSSATQGYRSRLWFAKNMSANISSRRDAFTAVMRAGAEGGVGQSSYKSSYSGGGGTRAQREERTLNSISVGSSGRTRTYNPSLTAEFQGEAARIKKRKPLKTGPVLSRNHAPLRMACNKSSYKSSYSQFG